MSTQDIAGLASAMGNYVQDNPGFSTGMASSMPTDHTLLVAIAGAWH